MHSMSNGLVAQAGAVGVGGGRQAGIVEPVGGGQGEVQLGVRVLRRGRAVGLRLGETDVGRLGATCWPR